MDTITPTDGYTHLINNNHYIFKITVIAAAGDQSVSQDIKPSAIKALQIEDMLSDFYHKGFIVVDNSFDILERDTPDLVAPTNPSYYDYNNATNAQDQSAGFLFQGESRDILRIEIMPQFDQTNASSMGPEDGQKLFRMTYDFVVYNSEEIPGDQPDKKFKKLYFWDIYYQLMLEKNVQFTTATIQDTTTGNATSLTTTASGQDPKTIEAGINTGIILREFIKATFPTNDGYTADIGTSVPGVEDVNTLTQQEQDNGNVNWDIGGSKLFFSTPANYKAIDCVNYILSRHVSNVASNYDYCILRLERYPRQFSLKSITQYFRQAYSSGVGGDLYLETVKLGGFTNQDAHSENASYFTPAGELYFDRIGTIKSYSYDNMAGAISQNKLVPYMVHSYDNQNKQFNIDVIRNGVVEAMKTYQSNYVNTMPSTNSKPAYPNFAPGQYRYLNKNIKHVFSTVQQNPDQRLAFGKNKFLYASVFTNNLMSFRLPGSTHRQAGRFIGIDRDGAVPISKFDNKLLGVYFIIGVNHIFKGNEYYNDIHCVKTYNFHQYDNTFDNSVADGSLAGLISKGY